MARNAIPREFVASTLAGSGRFVLRTGMAILGVDISYWQDPEAMPWDELRDGGIRFAIVKASMGGGYDKRCDAHADRIKSAGIDLGLYHWVDPTQDWLRQADFFLDKIEKHNPRVACFDVEQYWADWKDKSLPRISSTKQIDCFNAITDRIILAGPLPQERLWVYTAKWFTDLYPDLVDVIKPFNKWIASYVRGQFGISEKTKVSWERLDEIIDQMQGPVLPEGINDHLVWQFESIFILPPVDFNLDLNLFNGNEEDYALMMEKPMPPLPPPPPPPSDDLYEQVATLGADLKATRQLVGILQSQQDDHIAFHRRLHDAHEVDNG